MELRALDAAGVQVQSRERAERCSSSMVLGSGTRHWRLWIERWGKRGEGRWVAWLRWDPEEDLESGGVRGKDGTALLDFRVGLIHI